MGRIWLFPLLSQNGCSQSLSFSDRWSRGTKTLGTRLVGLSPQFNTLCFFSHLVPRASKQPHGTHFDVAMATCLFPVSWLFKFKYYQLRLNKAKYLVSSKTCASPTFHWASPLTCFCIFCSEQLPMVIFDFEEERDWNQACCHSNITMCTTWYIVQGLTSLRSFNSIASLLA